MEVSAGSAKVAELVRRHGASAIARRVGVSHVAVGKIARGSTPREPLRRKFLEIFEVPLEVWEQQRENVDLSAKTSTDSPKSAAIAPLTPRARLADMLERLDRQLARLDGDQNASAREVAQVAASVTGAMRLLAKLDGPTVVSEATILRSEAWTRIRHATLVTLAAFPDALQAVVGTWQAMAE